MDYYDEPSAYYDVALVCLNGHVVNDRFVSSPEFNKKFCDRCGEPTISACPACNKSIQGDYINPSVAIIGIGQMPAPGFCQHCGKAFPWTDMKLAAAKEVADELDGISSEDKAMLKQTLDDLVREGPRTEPAKLRFKRIMKKVGKESYETMRGVVTNLVSEAIKKSMFGP